MEGALQLFKVSRQDVQHDAGISCGACPDALQQGGRIGIVELNRGPLQAFQALADLVDAAAGVLYKVEASILHQRLQKRISQKPLVGIRAFVDAQPGLRGQCLADGAQILNGHGLRFILGCQAVVDQDDRVRMELLQRLKIGDLIVQVILRMSGNHALHAMFMAQANGVLCQLQLLLFRQEEHLAGLAHGKNTIAIDLGIVRDQFSEALPVDPSIFQHGGNNRRVHLKACHFDHPRFNVVRHLPTKTHCFVYRRHVNSSMPP